jgi:hypothetical protein
MSETDASPVLTDKIADFSTRKLELIEGAAEVFARAGYHGCSMRDVAERIGIRQSSIYHHFPFPRTRCSLRFAPMAAKPSCVNIRAIRAEKNGTRLAKIEAVIRAHITPYVLRQHYAYSFVFHAPAPDREGESGRLAPVRVLTSRNSKNCCARAWKSGETRSGNRRGAWQTFCADRHVQFGVFLGKARARHFA